jgi:hypothetical protein
VASLGGLLVERNGRALLTDAGVGPVTVGPPLNTYGVITGGALLDNLATQGRSPADTDAVARAHLHNDAIWLGLTSRPPAATVPAFTGADCLVAAPEWTQRHVRRRRAWVT